MPVRVQQAVQEDFFDGDPRWSDLADMLNEGIPEEELKEAIKTDPPRYHRTCFLTDDLAKRTTKLTPDYLQIKLRRKIPIFVYGTLKTAGPHNQTFLSTCSTLGEAFTSTTDWIMRDVGGNFPAVTKVVAKEQQHLGARIYGEVWVVTPEQILELDLLQQNGLKFERQVHWVQLVDQSFPTKNGSMMPSLKCFMYLAKPQWIHQQANSLCVKKMSDNTKLRTFYSWDPRARTQFSSMQERWRNYDKIMNRGSEMMDGMAETGSYPL